MNKLSVCLVGAAAFAAITALPASAASVVNVYVGYLNNLSGPPTPSDIPTPFDSSATTTLISSGGVGSPHDTGVIRFENTSASSVTIGPFVAAVVYSTPGPVIYQPWGFLAPFVLAPGQNLVLAETANFNFDSSDFPPFSAVAQVFGSVNGQAFGFNDVHRVLYGHEDTNGPGETTPYDLIGSVPVAAVPIPSAAFLLGGALAGMAAVSRRRAA